MIGDRVYSEYPIGRLAYAGVNLIAEVITRLSRKYLLIQEYIKQLTE